MNLSRHSSDNVPNGGHCTLSAWPWVERTGGFPYNIEERIVSGGIRALSRPELRSVLIEMDNERDEQKTKIYDLMTEAGLAPAERHPLTNPR